MSSAAGGDGRQEAGKGKNNDEASLYRKSKRLCTQALAGSGSCIGISLSFWQQEYGYRDCTRVDGKGKRAWKIIAGWIVRVCFKVCNLSGNVGVYTPLTTEEIFRLVVDC